MDNRISIISSTSYIFLIFDSPNEVNLHKYIYSIKSLGCKKWVRACHPLYNDVHLIQSEINVYDFIFNDGGVPSNKIIKTWISLLKKSRNETIGVHCLAGLGRAPLLVAIAFMEDGIKPLDAIRKIREARPGAFNMPQLRFLKNYKPISRKRFICWCF